MSLEASQRLFEFKEGSINVLKGFEGIKLLNDCVAHHILPEEFKSNSSKSSSSCRPSYRTFKTSSSRFGLVLLKPSHGCLVGWLVDWLVGWLLGWLVCWLKGGDEFVNCGCWTADIITFVCETS